MLSTTWRRLASKFWPASEVLASYICCKLCNEHSAKQTSRPWDAPATRLKWTAGRTNVFTNILSLKPNKYFRDDEDTECCTNQMKGLAQSIIALMKNLVCQNSEQRQLALYPYQSGFPTAKLWLSREKQYRFVGNNKVFQWVEKKLLNVEEVCASLLLRYSSYLTGDENLMEMGGA